MAWQLYTLLFIIKYLQELNFRKRSFAYILILQELSLTKKLGNLSSANPYKCIEEVLFFFVVVMFISRTEFSSQVKKDIKLYTNELAFFK